MKYSELVTQLTEMWLKAMKSYDSYLLNHNAKDIEIWYEQLGKRRDIQNKIEELVENSKLYRDRNGL